MKNKNITGGILALGLTLSACGAGHVLKRFDDRPGDVLAGYEATVQEKWYNHRQVGEDGPAGYILYLATQDCPAGVELGTPRADDECKTVEHPVELDLYHNLEDGEAFQWQGADGRSRVVEHRFADRRSSGKVYDFGLLVQQCVDANPCVTDIVPVDFMTWENTQLGQSLTFSGDIGKAVS